MKILGTRRQLAVVGAAVAAAVVPVPASLVERFYSAGAFPRFQPFLVAASNRVSVALLDLLLASAIVWAIVGIGFDMARGAGRGSYGWPQAVARSLWRVAAWAATAYLVFLLAWGLNYRRVPLADKLSVNPAQITPAAVQSLAALAAGQLTVLYEPAHREGWAVTAEPSSRLAVSFADTVRELGVVRPVVLGRPKTTMLDWYFRRAGVEGMTDPFFLETLVATELLPFERPFVVAHEWSHLAGFADEGDANFAGWLTCLHGSPADQYSGWLFLFGEVVRSLDPDDRAAAIARLGPASTGGPRDDLRAIADRQRRQIDPRLAAVGWRAYDRYLRANHVDAGAASYGHVVRLVLGTRFADGWIPELRTEK